MPPHHLKAGAAVAASDTESAAAAGNSDNDAADKPTKSAQKSASRKWEDIKGESGLDGYEHELKA